jgi:hypothetical protein
MAMAAGFGGIFYKAESGKMPPETDGYSDGLQ